MKLAIVIPAHNEERRIGPTIKHYLDFFGKLNDLSFEIIVVLNACTDRTREIVEQYSCKQLIILEFKRGGKGFAVIEGFKEAIKRKAEFIGFVDADMATTPAAYFQLYKKIGKADGAIADRYIKGAILYPKPTIARRVVSRMYNAIIRALFLMPYRDTQCGAKLFKRSALENIIKDVGMTKWAFDTEVIFLLRKKGYSVISVPTSWSDKEYSKINAFSAGPIMLLGLIRLRILHSPFRRFIRAYDLFAVTLRKLIKK